LKGIQIGIKEAERLGVMREIDRKGMTLKKASEEIDSVVTRYLSKAQCTVCISRQKRSRIFGVSRSNSPPSFKVEEGILD